MPTDAYETILDYRVFFCGFRNFFALVPVLFEKSPSSHNVVNQAVRY